MLTHTCPGPPPAAIIGVAPVFAAGCSAGAGVGVAGFQLKKGFLAGVGVAEVVSAEGEAVAPAVVFLALGSFAGGGVAEVAS